MYSFYGGRPGNSFIIITTYRSIADMVSKFKLGPNYTAVHYDEHVMINTDNKNDPDNGKIYRRGYDFNNDMGGAEFIGTVVGPSGNSPMVEMSTIADVKRKQGSEGYTERFSQGSYSLKGSNLVPGKTANGYNDEIKWACYSMRNQNGEDTTVYVGFTFPYTVIDYEVSKIKPYADGEYRDTSSILRIDDETHPFYEKWHIDIPEGIKGDAIKNFKVEVASDNVQSYTGQSDDINNNRMILAYDYYHYDNHENGDPVRLYLGDYNMISNISINDEGTITIDYTHDDDKVFTKKLKWIKSISLNNETGDFKAIYNHTTDASGNPTEYNVQLKWVKNIQVNNDGTVSIIYTKGDNYTYDNLIKWVTGIELLGDGTVKIQWNNGSEDTIFENIIKWISSVTLSNDGTLTVSYNNNTEPTVFSNTLKWITGINLSDDGTLTVNYNNNDTPYIANKKIKWINNISLSNTGRLTVNYNTGEVEDIAQQIQWITSMNVLSTGDVVYNFNTGLSQTIPNLIKWISFIQAFPEDGSLQYTWNDGTMTIINAAFPVLTNAEVATGAQEGTGNQKIRLTFNNNNVMQIGNPINYVMNMAVNNNNHLLVRYSDPERRATGIEYNGTTGWTDIGQINQQYEYKDGSIATGLNWIGIGQLIDDGTNNKVLKFTISIDGLINQAVNTIIPTAGFINGSNGTNTITALNLSTATITKMLTGLQFEIDSGITSGGAAATDFINLSITGMGLSFSAASA